MSQVGHGSATVRMIHDRITKCFESYKPHSDRLNLVYEYRYRQVLCIVVRLAIMNCVNFDGIALDASARSGYIAPFLRSMELLQLIQNDEVLNRWCSVQKRDYHFNMDAIQQASLLYPEAERCHILEAGNLGKNLALHTISEAKQQAQRFLAEAEEWERLASAAEKSGEFSNTIM